jgi:hypothetical protein
MKRKLESWLTFVAIAHVVLGLAVPFIAYSGAFDAYAAQVAAAFWGGGAVPPEAQAYQRWMVALFGPTVASWGVLMFFVVREGARTQAQWPWNALLIAILVWAPADIVISLMHEFWPHVVIDAIAIVGIALPALLLRMRSGVLQGRGA